jgi:hypothetical protein
MMSLAVCPLAGSILRFEFHPRLSRKLASALVDCFVIVAGAIPSYKASTKLHISGRCPSLQVTGQRSKSLPNILLLRRDKKITDSTNPTTIASIKMHFLAPIFATITALSTLVSASGYTDPAWSMTTHNASALFGYQLLGSNMFNTSAVCNNISIASHGLWNAAIDDTYIERKLHLVLSYRSLQADGSCRSVL